MLEELKQEAAKNTKKTNKLAKLLVYVVKYKDLVFTSYITESNVASLINQHRQK